jgi:tRNA-binding protein
MNNLTWADFEKVEIRVGTILTAEPFAEARNPSFKLTIDFGPNIGVKKSSAQITNHYTCEALIGRQIVAVVNFPPKQIANIMSECLVLGAVDDAHAVTILTPEKQVDNGLRIK